MGIPIQDKVKTAKVVDKQNNKDIRLKNDVEELDNSSFSLEQQLENQASIC